MLPHLKKYISETNPKNAPDSENFVSGKKVLKEAAVLEAKPHFSSMIATEVEEFLTLFQRNDPFFFFR